MQQLRAELSVALEERAGLQSACSLLLASLVTQTLLAQHFEHAERKQASKVRVVHQIEPPDRSGQSHAVSNNFKCCLRQCLCDLRHVAPR